MYMIWVMAFAQCQLIFPPLISGTQVCLTSLHAGPLTSLHQKGERWAAATRLDEARRGDIYIQG